MIGESIEAGSRQAPAGQGLRACGLLRSNWLRPNVRLRSNAFSRSAGNCIRFRRIGKPPSSNPIAYSQFAAVDNRKKWFVNKFMPASLFERTPTTEQSGGHLPRVFHDLSVSAAPSHCVLASPFRHGTAPRALSWRITRALVTSFVFFASHVEFQLSRSGRRRHETHNC